MAIPTSGYASQSVTNPGGALTDFTLIIDLADVISDQPDFSTDWNTDTGGYGKATKGDGTTELATDWIDLDNGSETGWVRVKWSGTLASSGTQTVRLFPPNTGNDLYAASDTYGSDNAYRSSFNNYYPLEDLNDRTVNSRDGSLLGTPTAGQTGQVATAYDFTTSGQGIDLGASSVGNGLTNGFSLMAWVNVDATPSENGQIISADGDSDRCWQFRVGVDDGFVGFIRFDTGDSVVANFAGDVDIRSAGWTHVTVTFDTSNGSEIWIDKVSDATDADTTANNDDTTPIIIGNISRDSNNNLLEGLIDEAQIHTVRLSDEWIAAEFDQTNDNGAFWGTWAWTSAGATFNEAIAETVGLAETQAVILTIPVAIAESIGMSETQATTLDINISVSETFGLTDAQTAAVDMVVAIAEAIGLTDTQSVGANTFDVSISETIGLSDAQSATFEISIAIAEGIGLSDIQSTVATFAAQIAETFGLTDVVTSGDLANGKVCVTISASKSVVTITATKSTITITGTKPNVDITGEGC